MKGFKLLLLFFILLLSFASSLFAQQPHSATILKISDGDTVWVLMDGHEVKLRLLGIDTPEKYPGKKLERDARKCGVSQGYMKNLGQEATHHAKSLLHKGQKVKVVTYGRGYYGRTLAIIYLPDGTNYNEKMVADGYACVYRYHAHKGRQLFQEERKKLNQLLEEAKKNRRGLWERYYKVMECLCR